MGITMIMATAIVMGMGTITIKAIFEKKTAGEAKHLEYIDVTPPRDSVPMLRPDSVEIPGFSRTLESLYPSSHSSSRCYITGKINVPTRLLSCRLLNCLLRHPNRC